MKPFGLIVPVLLLLAACGSRAEPSGHVDATGIAPALVLERFLQAANRQDLETMARLWGNAEGLVIDRDPRAEVEQRLYATALILKHDDFQIQGEQIIPGRPEALQLIVRMHIGGRQVPVAYTMVRSKNGAWLVEAIDLEAITAGR
ncbi:MAG TPA: hypothetical protein VIL18_10570 [Longimicrobiales bacterium]